MDTHDAFLVQALATCNYPPKHIHILEAAGYKNIQTLLSAHLSFPTQGTPIDHAGMKGVIAILNAIDLTATGATTPGAIDADEETTQLSKFLTLMQECRAIRSASSATAAKAAAMWVDEALPQPKMPPDRGIAVISNGVLHGAGMSPFTAPSRTLFSLFRDIV